jgi:hypothetical protein
VEDPLKPFLELVSYLENRAMDTLKKVEDLNHKIAHPRGKWKGEDKQEGLFQKLTETEEVSKMAILLVDDLTTLYYKVYHHRAAGDGKDMIH